MSDVDINATNPSIVSHVSIGTNQFDAAIAFYDAVLGAMGIRKLMDFPGAVAYGREFPEFWVQNPVDGEKATIGNGTHFGFFARTKDEVNAFWGAALTQNAKPGGEPGPREEYGAPY